ncbi:hypothetical protein SBA3_2580001 [Candidatus Sulfopaludibacter sp. SbA3]|nr:hypothetical protein SBA3_2580001 [Candidatus Sulfopaludibacter sp. SbA3]
MKKSRDKHDLKACFYDADSGPFPNDGRTVLPEETPTRV